MLHSASSLQARRTRACETDHLKQTPLIQGRHTVQRLEPELELKRMQSTEEEERTCKYAQG
jgi:hypothetical protein